MEPNDWRKYLIDEKDKYKKLGHVKCPAFDNEKVYFNHYGLHHLIFKDKKLRSKNDVAERFGLLSYAPNILKGVKSINNEEKRIKEQSVAYFWTIKNKIGSKGIRIILRRLNNGTIHFFSIMKD